MNQTIDSLRTIRDFIRWGASCFNEAQLFFGHGTDNALDEASVLVLHALHLPPDLPPTYLKARLTNLERQTVLDLLQRRITERCPAAYLTQRAWFAGIELHIDKRVLVPRSPLAELIENRFNPWLDSQNLHRVLDLCTGSGCIGIAVAIHLPHTEVDLTDISKDAIAVANSNVKNFNIESRVRVLTSDLFTNLQGERYDLILSNPPYVASEELAALPEEYHCEPSLGLEGGADGLNLVRRILRDARHHLNPDGAIIIEVGNNASNIEHLYPQVPFLWLAFERGGEGVFMLTAEQLERWANIFTAEANDRL